MDAAGHSRSRGPRGDSAGATESGADVNKTWDHGVTPLLIAAEKGHEAIVQALVELGTDINKAMDDGATPLSIAAQQGHTAIVTILDDAVLVQMLHLSL